MDNKVFISGRVSGLKPDTVRKNFARVEKKYKAIGYEVVNPTKLCKKEWSWLRCMVVCLWNLAKCEYVYMIPNYKYSRGAKFELWFANFLGKNRYFWMEGLIVNKCKDCKYRDREIGRERCANPIYSCRLTHRQVWPIDDACENFVTNTIVSTKREKQG